jgi:hypothetical protein
MYYLHIYQFVGRDYMQVPVNEELPQEYEKLGKNPSIIYHGSTELSDNVGHKLRVMPHINHHSTTLETVLSTSPLVGRFLESLTDGGIVVRQDTLSSGLCVSGDPSRVLEITKEFNRRFAT